MHQNKNTVKFRLQAQGLYNFVRGLLGGLINGGAYIRGGGIKKKNVSKWATAVLMEILLLIFD